MGSVLRGNSIMKLFCIPYSGGNANVYRDWEQRLSGLAKITAIEYRGHGSLFGQDLYNSISEVCDDLIERYFRNNHEKYIIYGHSLGSLVTYELTRELRKRGCLMPEHIVLASLRPPHLLYRRQKYTTMSKDAFMERIINLGNTPREVLENEELREIVFELLYADMKLVDDYAIDDIDVLDTPISVFAGIEDHEAPEDEMKEWNKYTSKNFELKMLGGNHFFAFQESGHDLLMGSLEALLRKYAW